MNVHAFFTVPQWTTNHPKRSPVIMRLFAGVNLEVAGVCFLFDLLGHHRHGWWFQHASKILRGVMDRVQGCNLFDEMYIIFVYTPPVSCSYQFLAKLCKRCNLEDSKWRCAGWYSFSFLFTCEWFSASSRELLGRDRKPPLFVTVDGQNLFVY